MYKLEVYSKGKLIGTHWYEEKEECYNAAFALHNHPMFSHRTEVSHKPNAFIAYDSAN